MIDDLDAALDAEISRLSPETCGLLDFLTDRPLSRYPIRSDRDKLLWAIRDLRATVRYEVYGTAPGHVVTLGCVDELLRSPGLSERVWARLLTAELRESIPLPHAPSSRPAGSPLHWLHSLTVFLRRR